ncbi:anti-sigma factor, partial [Agromyces humi]|uniref:anti-sigma factor n=1 Tax=Agromyces humi TaxID=1766800 RepID=UPI00193AC59F
RWWPVAAAAAAVGIVAGIAIGVGASGGFGSRPASQTIVATASLDAFPGWSATGSAQLEEGDDGVRSIVVDLDAEVPATDVREVWLIRSDASGLVSLGLLEGASGRFVVPDGIDLDEFTLVDVSAEPVDGDPAHSGDSIVRGELRRA